MTASSPSAVVVGVAGATIATAPILTAGVAALVGGAVSMALGEYVSVSSQSDSERALIEKEKLKLADDLEAELAELTALYQQQGLSLATAQQVAAELTAHDALSAHLSVELNIDENDVVSAWEMDVSVSESAVGLRPDRRTVHAIGDRSLGACPSAA